MPTKQPVLLRRDHHAKWDRRLFFLICLLIACGSVMVFSASYAYAQTRFGDHYYFIRKQILWAGAGIAVMLAVSFVPPEKLYRLTPAFYLAVSLLLLLVPLIGSEAGGAKRWIALGGFTFQPSELAKSVLILMLARYYTDMADKVSAPRHKGRSFLFGILIPFGLLGLYCGLIVLEKHLSCIIILGCIALFMMLLGGASARILGSLCLVGATGVGVFAMAVEYTRRRILIWRNPQLYPTDGGWQTLQGLMAIGSGGFFGLGLGNSRLKYMYVSEPQNDFIFTIVCEELGFLGAAGVLLLFALFVRRGMTIALSAQDSFSRLAAAGLTGKVAIQVLLNIAVVTNLLPNTGISLPFFSYGGSSLVMLFAEMGILLSISRHTACKSD